MNSATVGGEAITANSGAEALAFALRVLSVPADAAEISHHSGKPSLAENDVLRAAKRFPVKARAITSNFERLRKTPLPALAALKDGSWLVIGKVAEDKLLIQRAPSPRPDLMSREVFLECWNGRLILLARRAPLGDPTRRFGISWFVGAVGKYRAVLGEVLLASFFLQLFALITPLFFQVVIDKVLIHRGLSTLDVLMIGLAVIALFDVSLGGIRSYVFAHTTNRIDVELGARLFRHLFALPIAYFQSRRVGDSVARVRELENIRQFITGSALTLIIDISFTGVFLAVMFYYSPLLTWIVMGAFPFYIALSLSVVPSFRRRLDEKFKRGAENQAFLVESVTGIETIKAMAVEPQMQARWEEQLAGFVQSSFSTLTLATTATQIATFINKVVVVLTLFFGAQLVIAGQLTVGELVAFNMLAGNVSGPVLRLAQLWQDFQQSRVSIDRLGDILNAQPEPSIAGTASLSRIRGDVEFQHVIVLVVLKRKRFRIRLHGIQSALAQPIDGGDRGKFGQGRFDLKRNYRQ